MPTKVDVWALGIVAFSLVAGFFPLLEAKESDWRFKKLKNDQDKGIGASKSIFKTYKRECPFSPALVDLIDGMLTIDFRKRLPIAAVCGHEWIKSEPAPPSADGGGAVYRGAMGGDDDELMDEFSVPEDAIQLCRQPARRGVPMEMDAAAIS